MSVSLRSRFRSSSARGPKGQLSAPNTALMACPEQTEFVFTKFLCQTLRASRRYRSPLVRALGIISIRSGKHGKRASRHVSKFSQVDRIPGPINCVSRSDGPRLIEARQDNRQLGSPQPGIPGRIGLSVHNLLSDPNLTPASRAKTKVAGPSN